MTPTLHGHNTAALCITSYPAGQQNAYAALGGRPLTRNSLYEKAAKDYRLMKDCPWGWVRKNSNALPPFPRAVTGFCPGPGLYSIFPARGMGVSASRARYGGHCLPSKTGQQNAYVTLGDRPLTRNSLYGKAAKDYRLMKDCPWGWIRTNSNALPPFPRAVTGFCPVLEGRQRPPARA